MVSLTDVGFNPAPPSRMHIDLNSCFASIEQQQNPLLRGRPIAVAAYTTSSGCIVAPSVEAKQFGVKTGQRVKDGRRLCRELVVLPPDPDKYRYIHLKLRRLLGEYTDRLVPKSIDEFALDLTGCPALRVGLVETAQEIKARIRREIGDWLRVSIGIAPNRLLAKQAAGLHKPDGLDVIDRSNYEDIYAGWQLTDLSGINTRYAARLHAAGIHTVLEMGAASDTALRRAFGSIIGQHWYARLRGYEVDDLEVPRRSYGAMYALPEPLSTPDQLAPILTKLANKAATRMRRGGYVCRTVHLAVTYRDGNHWHQQRRSAVPLLDSREITRRAYLLLCASPHRAPVRGLGVTCTDLERDNAVQAGLFDTAPDARKMRLVSTLDEINQRYGPWTIAPAAMLAAASNVPDRISFGGVSELEEIVSGSGLV